MKGLILKDLYMSAKYFRNYILILILFLAVSVMNPENLFFAFYPILICSMLPVNLLAYDERSHWESYCCTLPVTRDMVVSAKYLVGLIFQGAVLVLTAVTQSVSMTVRGNFSFENLLVLLSLMAALSLISASITPPFMFKLGVEKGRMAYYVMIGFICGGGALSAIAMEGQLQSEVTLGMVLAGVLVLAVAIYCLSWYLSIRFYRRRELH